MLSASWRKRASLSSSASVTCRAGMALRNMASAWRRPSITTACAQSASHRFWSPPEDGGQDRRRGGEVARLPFDRAAQHPVDAVVDGPHGLARESRKGNPHDAAVVGRGRGEERGPGGVPRHQHAAVRHQGGLAGKRFQPRLHGEGARRHPRAGNRAGVRDGRHVESVGTAASAAARGAGEFAAVLRRSRRVTGAKGPASEPNNTVRRARPLASVARVRVSARRRHASVGAVRVHVASARHARRDLGVFKFV